MTGQGLVWAAVPRCCTDLPLTRSIHSLWPTAEMLVSAGFLVVLVLLDVPDFRPVLARGWHAVCWGALHLRRSSGFSITRGEGCGAGIAMVPVDRGAVACDACPSTAACGQRAEAGTGTRDV
jgi:hypothetical protein